MVMIKWYGLSPRYNHSHTPSATGKKKSSLLWQKLGQLFSFQNSCLAQDDPSLTRTGHLASWVSASHSGASYLGNLIPTAKTVMCLFFTCIAGTAVLPWDFPSEMMIRTSGTLEFLPPGKPLWRMYFRARPVSVLPPLESRDIIRKEEIKIPTLLLNLPFGFQILPSGNGKCSLFLLVTTQHIHGDVCTGPIYSPLLTLSKSEWSPGDF